MISRTTPNDVLRQAAMCVGAAVLLAVAVLFISEGKSASLIGLLYWLKVFGFIASFPLIIYVAALGAENPNKWYGTVGMVLMLACMLVLALVGFPLIYMALGFIYRGSRQFFFALCLIAFYAICFGFFSWDKRRSIN